MEWDRVGVSTQRTGIQTVIPGHFVQRPRHHAAAECTLFEFLIKRIEYRQTTIRVIYSLIGIPLPFYLANTVTRYERLPLILHDTTTPGTLRLTHTIRLFLLNTQRKGDTRQHLLDLQSDKLIKNIEHTMLFQI